MKSQDLKKLPDSLLSAFGVHEFRYFHANEFSPDLMIHNGRFVLRAGSFLYMGNVGEIDKKTEYAELRPFSLMNSSALKLSGSAIRCRRKSGDKRLWVRFSREGEYDREFQFDVAEKSPPSGSNLAKIQGTWLVVVGSIAELTGEDLLKETPAPCLHFFLDKLTIGSLEAGIGIGLVWPDHGRIELLKGQRFRMESPFTKHNPKRVPMEGSYKLLNSDTLEFETQGHSILLRRNNPSLFIEVFSAGGWAELRKKEQERQVAAEEEAQKLLKNTKSAYLDEKGNYEPAMAIEWLEFVIDSKRYDGTSAAEEMQKLLGDLSEKEKHARDALEAIKKAYLNPKKDYRPEKAVQQLEESILRHRGTKAAKEMQKLLDELKEWDQRMSNPGLAD